MSAPSWQRVTHFGSLLLGGGRGPLPPRQCRDVFDRHYVLFT